MTLVEVSGALGVMCPSLSLCACARMGSAGFGSTRARWGATRSGSPSCRGGWPTVATPHHTQPRATGRRSELPRQHPGHERPQVNTELGAPRGDGARRVEGEHYVNRRAAERVVGLRPPERNVLRAELTRATPAGLHVSHPGMESCRTFRGRGRRAARRSRGSVGAPSRPNSRARSERYRAASCAPLRSLTTARGTAPGV